MPLNNEDEVHTHKDTLGKEAGKQGKLEQPFDHEYAAYLWTRKVRKA